MDKTPIALEWSKLFNRTQEAITAWQSEGGSPWLDSSALLLQVVYGGKDSDPRMFPLNHHGIYVKGDESTTQDYLDRLRYKLIELAWVAAPSSSKLWNHTWDGTSYVKTIASHNPFLSKGAPLLSNRAYNSSIRALMSTLDAWIVAETKTIAN